MPQPRVKLYVIYDFSLRGYISYTVRAASLKYSKINYLSLRSCELTSGRTVGTGFQFQLWVVFSDDF
jgi:hypothetical protein